MVVTLYARTSLGPYERSSVFVTSAGHAQRLMDEYGLNKQLVDAYGRPANIREGGTYYIVDARPYPPGPGPFPPRNFINVYFYVDVDTYRDLYYAGETYQLSPDLLARIIQLNPQLFVSDSRGNKIYPQDYDNYVGRTLYVNQSVILYSLSPQLNAGPYGQ